MNNYDLDPDLFLDTRRITTTFQWQDKFLRQNGLSHSAMFALALIAMPFERGLPFGALYGMTGLVRMMGLAPSSVVRLIDELSDSGYASRIPRGLPPAQDKRTVGLVLTTEGHRVLLEFMEQMGKIWNQKDRKKEASDEAA